MNDALRLAGGLGLFLLGMVVMTEGLRAVAGDALNRVLYRFTKSPATGALTGAGVTALLQSSSATTVATVGFVSAGLLTFPQSLGVLFGANIGTTMTGWLVALIGFKLSLGTAMLPLLLVGVLLRLFTSGRWRHLGWALAGFALIFLGIEQLRSGMQSFEGALTPDMLPGDSLGGRLALVGIGVAITLVTQSSSAGVAIALTALHTGAIAFPQAAAMVIGMDAGTTSTTALATIGGSPQTKRTGWSHVIYNLLTALGALLFLPLYIAALDQWVPGARGADPELALVGFHSAFNTLGVLLVLPFTRRFAALMIRLIPDRGPALTRRLDLGLLADAAAATPALWATTRDLAAHTFAAVGDHIRKRGARADGRLSDLESAVDETRRYADRLPRGDGAHDVYRFATMHCLDHLDRLLDRARQTERVEAAHRDPRLRALTLEFAEALRTMPLDTAEALGHAEAACLRRRDALHAERRPFRAATIERVGADHHLEEAIARLDAVRWLHRSAYHAWRILHHLCVAEGVEHTPRPDEIPARSEQDPDEVD